AFGPNIERKRIAAVSRAGRLGSAGDHRRNQGRVIEAVDRGPRQGGVENSRLINHAAEEETFRFMVKRIRSAVAARADGPTIRDIHRATVALNGSDQLAIAIE